MFDFPVTLKITPTREGLPRIYVIDHCIYGGDGRILYFVTNEGEYINHDNIWKFKELT